MPTSQEVTRTEEAVKVLNEQQEAQVAKTDPLVYADDVEMRGWKKDPQEIADEKFKEFDVKVGTGEPTMAQVDEATARQMQEYADAAAKNSVISLLSSTDTLHDAGKALQTKAHFIKSRQSRDLLADAGKAFVKLANTNYASLTTLGLALGLNVEDHTPHGTDTDTTAEPRHSAYLDSIRREGTIREG